MRTTRRLLPSALSISPLRKPGLSLAAALVLLVVTMLSGCSRDRYEYDQGTLAINSFHAVPDLITTGASTTLAWEVTGAVSISISDGSESSGGTGGIALTPITANTVTVTPTQSTTYTLTATDVHGATETAVAIVSVFDAPAINSFTASPAVISNTQATTLNFNVIGAQTITIDNGVGVVTGNSVSVAPASTTTYTISVSNAAGQTVTAQATVTVVQVPIIVSFTALPAAIGGGQSSTLSWSVIGDTSLSLDNGIGTVTGNSISVNPAQTTTFTLTAYNMSNGVAVSSSAHLTVTVEAVPPPSISSFTASAASVGTDGEVVLTAVFVPSDGSATATIDNGVGPVTSGSPVDTPPIATSTNYTLTVTNASGSATAIVRVIAGDVSVFAGMPTDAGDADGQGNAARFYQPSGIVSDGSGNLFVVDSGNDTIREITPNGTVSTYAGQPQNPGYMDGPAAQAQFNEPSGITIDSAENLYVTDDGMVRVISAAGNVSTLAGTDGVVGYMDGTGGNAQFGNPGSITIDTAGNLYVVDSLNCNVREVTPGGVVTTIAGPMQFEICGSKDGEAAAARFSNPLGIAIDNSGNLYVADTNNQTIREVSTDGVVTTIAGTSGVAGSADGPAATATFHGPSGLSTDGGGNLYITDSQNYTIRRLSPAGAVATLAGTAGMVNALVPGGPLPSVITTPEQIATDAVTGQLYFTLTAVEVVATAPY